MTVAGRAWDLAVMAPLLPTTRLVQCLACSEHIRAHESRCPHCGARQPGETSSLAATAVAMSLALAGCTGASSVPAKDDKKAEPAPVTKEVLTPVKKAEPIGPTAEYGVPVTREPIGEPEYGVPVTPDPAPTPAPAKDAKK